MEKPSRHPQDIVGETSPVISEPTEGGLSRKESEQKSPDG